MKALNNRKIKPENANFPEIGKISDLEPADGKKKKKDKKKGKDF